MVAPLLCVLLHSAFGQADGGHKPTIHRFEVPQMIQHADIPGETISQGVPVKMQAVRSKLPLPEVLQYFVAEFEKKGLYIPPPEHQPQMTGDVQLNAIDVDQLISYSVILKPHSDGTTSIVIGYGRLYARAKAANLAFVPMPEGSSPPTVTHTEGAAMQVFTYSGKPEGVTAFYDARLKTLGYDKKDAHLWRRGGEELRLSVQGAGPGKHTVLLLKRNVEGASPK